MTKPTIAPVSLGSADPFIGHMLRLLDVATDPRISLAEASKIIDAMPCPTEKLANRTDGPDEEAERE